VSSRRRPVDGARSGHALNSGVRLSDLTVDNSAELTMLPIGPARSLAAPCSGRGKFIGIHFGGEQRLGRV